MKRDFGIVSIIGPGLIGGSIGLGLKKRGLASQIIGVGHRKTSLKKALDMGAIDKATQDLREGVRRADIVILGTSVRQIPGMAKKVMPWMKSSSILTDVGSTKAHIVEKIEAMRRKDVEFIGSHPLAGSERRGVEAANPDLFQGATCVLTTTKNSRAKERIKELWEGLGAQVRFLSPEEHDRILAFTSHLPHLLAASLVNNVKANQRPFAGRAFKDLTRVASGDPNLWVDICLENREELLKAIKALQGEINTFRKVLQKRDKKRLLSELKKAKTSRDRLINNQRPLQK